MSRFKTKKTFANTESQTDDPLKILYELISKSLEGNESSDSLPEILSSRLLVARFAYMLQLVQKLLSENKSLRGKNHRASKSMSEVFRLMKAVKDEYHTTFVRVQDLIQEIKDDYKRLYDEFISEIGKQNSLISDEKVRVKNSVKKRDILIAELKNRLNAAQNNLTAFSSAFELEQRRVLIAQKQSFSSNEQYRELKAKVYDNLPTENNGNCPVCISREKLLIALNSEISDKSLQLDCFMEKIKRLEDELEGQKSLKDDCNNSSQTFSLCTESESDKSTNSQSTEKSNSVDSSQGKSSQESIFMIEPDEIDTHLKQENLLSSDGILKKETGKIEEVHTSDLGEETKNSNQENGKEKSDSQSSIPSNEDKASQSAKKTHEIKTINSPIAKKRPFLSSAGGFMPRSKTIMLDSPPNPPTIIRAEKSISSRHSKQHQPLANKEILRPESEAVWVKDPINPVLPQNQQYPFPNNGQLGQKVVPPYVSKEKFGAFELQPNVFQTNRAGAGTTDNSTWRRLTTAPNRPKFFQVPPHPMAQIQQQQQSTNIHPQHNSLKISQNPGPLHQNRTTQMGHQQQHNQQQLQNAWLPWHSSDRGSSSHTQQQQQRQQQQKTTKQEVWRKVPLAQREPGPTSYFPDPMKFFR